MVFAPKFLSKEFLSKYLPPTIYYKESISFIYYNIYPFFLIGGQLLYNIVLVSAIQQCESAISIYIVPLFWPFLPCHPHPIPLHRAPATYVTLLMLFSNFPLAIYFTHDNEYISMLLSQFVLPPPSPAMSTSTFSGQHHIRVYFLSLTYK